MKIKLFKTLFIVIYVFLYVAIIIGLFYLLGLIPCFQDDGTINFMFIIKALISASVTTVIFLPISRFKRIQRYIYTKLYFYACKTNSFWRKELISLLVKLFYLNELACNVDINDINSNKINIINGDCFSGKSYLVEKYIHENLYVKEIRNFYLFDIDKHDFEEFITKLKSSHFIETVIIIDNIDLLRNEQFNMLMSELKTKQNLYHKLIIVTSYKQYVESRFDKIEKLYVTDATVFREEQDILERYRTVVTEKNSFHNREQKTNTQRVQNKEHRRKQKTEKRLKKVIEPSDRTMVFLLFNSVFKMSESPKLLKLFQQSRLKLIFYRITLKRFQMTESLKFFNQHLAIRILLDNFQNELIRNSFTVLHDHFESLQKNLSAYKRWLALMFFYLIFGDPVQREIFDGVVLHYNLNHLLTVINMFLKLKDLDSNLKIHKAILLERCNFPFEAIELYKEIIGDAIKSHDDYLENYAKIGLVCCAHTRKDIDATIQTIKDDDIFILYSKRYWILHIDMHRGTFNYEGFKRLLSDLNDNANRFLDYPEYDVYHLFRRIYMETVRSYLLSYKNDINELKDLTDVTYPVPQYLYKHNPNEFDAFYFKFNLGRVLQFDYLSLHQFNDINSDLQIYDLLLELYTQKTRDVTTNDNITPLELNEKIYEKSIEQFRLIGGPQEQYVLFNKYELMLMKDPHQPVYVSDCYKFIEELIRYKSYCEEKKLLEYVHYAYIYLIKTYICQQLVPSEHGVDNTKNISRCLIACKNTMDKMKAQAEHVNIYAKCRLEMFEIFYRIITLNSNKNTDELKREKELIAFRCRELMTAYPEYKREINILSYIVQNKTEIKLGQLWDIIRYYPIVNQ